VLDTFYYSWNWKKGLNGKLIERMLKSVEGGEVNGSFDENKFDEHGTEWERFEAFSE
jgi:hypothetical protein